MNSDPPTGLRDNAIGSWNLNFNEADSAQLIFPKRNLALIPSHGDITITGTLIWTLMTRTP